MEALLTAWERGRAEPQITGRVLALLNAAFPAIARDSLEGLPIGQRDSLLLTLREHIFGTRLEALGACSGCGERLRFSFDVAHIRSEQQTPVPTLSLEAQHYTVEFRLPNSSDLLAVSDPSDLGQKRQRLLQRLVLCAKLEDQPVVSSELPEEVILAMESKMSEADPQAEVNVNLRCQFCEKHWQAPFDIGAYLWKEIDAWALRVLREIHLLARAYGWREADILAMSAWRRYAYLEMLEV
jgi:hypothetical protein